MNTTWMLMGVHGGVPIVPVDVVANSYFNTDTRTFLRKVDTGKIPLPIVRMERSQKSAKGVHVDDLAKYLDEQRANAIREMERLHS